MLEISTKYDTIGTVPAFPIPVSEGAVQNTDNKFESATLPVITLVMLGEDGTSAATDPNVDGEKIPLPKNVIASARP